VHGITIEKYKIKFPNASLWSNKQKKIKSNFSKGRSRGPMSQEQKDKISKTKKTKKLKLSEEHKKKISERSEQMWQDTEIREKILKSREDYWTDEVREEWSKKMKQQYIDRPEIKEKLKKTEEQKEVLSKLKIQYYKDHPEAIMRGKDHPMFDVPRTKEQKEAQSTRFKELWSDPKYKEKMKKKHQARYAKWTDQDRKDWANKMSEAQQRPGVLEKKNKAIKDAWDVPGRRETRSKLMKKIWKENPNLKKEQSKRAKARWKNPIYRKTMSKIFTEMWKNEDMRKRHSLSHQGSQSSFWIDGRSFWPYSIEWKQPLKRKIRERDGHICQECGQKNDGRKMEIHHIDYDKLNCNHRNLICLCKSCHAITTHPKENHWFWEEYFKRIMDIRFFPPESSYP